MIGAPKAAVSLLLAVLAACAHAHGLDGPTIPKATDKCTPFAPPAPYLNDPVGYVKYLDTLTNRQLSDMYHSLPAPAEGQGFPIAGCTYGWVPGKAIGARVARIPGLNMGWSGKCFGFGYNATTGTPTSLLNEFSSDWENFKLPQAKRVAGALAGKANVLWAPRSVDPATKGAVWRFDYDPAAPLYDPALGMDVEVNAIRDEVRMVRPGELLGRMYIKGVSGDTSAVPIYFSLFQACTADYKFPLAPGARQLPRIGVQA